MTKPEFREEEIELIQTTDEKENVAPLPCEKIETLNYDDSDVEFIEETTQEMSDEEWDIAEDITQEKSEEENEVNDLNNNILQEIELLPESFGSKLRMAS